ncbi:anti-sigma factor domain-containing protein [Microbacterium sp. G2-8]|uniref:anti-sigma factor n=1 Tax=Microbacterium sp. G2-8 TaxID=2842454 RepID=UPI001C8A3728|nr:anti-sigma factor [Microbacterium sp. G2-8]
MNDREFEQLAAGHALHALSPEDERAFRDAVAEDPRRAAQVRADESTVARLSDVVAPVEPPPRLRSELLARIADDEASSPLPTDGPDGSAAEPMSPSRDVPSDGTTRAPRRGSRRWFVLAASFVLLVAVGAGAFAAVQSLLRPPAVSALEAIEDAPDAQTADTALPDGGTATLHWSETRGSAVFVSSDLPEIDDDRQFELWLVRDGVPVPAGVFDPGADDTVALLEGEMEPGDVVAVTVEAAGGSPTGAPTTEPILAIPTS